MALCLKKMAASMIAVARHRAVKRDGNRPHLSCIISKKN